MQNQIVPFQSKQKEQLQTVVDMMRNGLTPSVRTTVGALIVVDVHGRDVLERLVAAKVERYLLHK